MGELDIMTAIWDGSEQFPLFGFAVRAAIAYLVLIVLIKILGQRSVSSLQPTDFLYAIVIGDVIGEPLTSGEDSFKGPLLAAFTLTAIHLGLTFTTLKWSKFRRITDDEPIFLIKDGKILRKQMKKTKVTLDMLLMELRLRGYPDVSEVDMAILEANGEISVIPKKETTPATKNDLNIPAPPVGYPVVLIEDGNVIEDNLKRHNLTESWLSKELKKRGVNDTRDVMLATVTKSGELYYSPR